MKQPSLNIAGKLADMFITSKLTLLMIMACLLIGLLGISFTPREENPQIVVPGAEIFVALPGASPLEVEQLVVNPLEAIVRELNGVDHTYAVAMNGQALVNVQFKVGENQEESLVKLYDRVLGTVNYLPDDASKPVIRSVDVDDVPIISITLSSAQYDDYALKRLADNMASHLQSLEDVSVVEVKGGRDLTLRVEPNPERLSAFGISLNQLVQSVKANNLSASMTMQTYDNKNYSLYVDGFLSSEEEVKKLVIAVHNKKPIYLQDVSSVVLGPLEERQTLSRFTFGPADHRFSQSTIEMPAVTIAVAKKNGSNAVVVANDILQRVEALKKTLVPSDVEVMITRNDGEKANASVNNLIEHLAIAIVSVIVVCILFLGFKEAMIVGITVPLILSLTLGVMYLMGLTINRISLFGLILSLGLLVDSAIVVIENIHRRYKQLKSENKSQITVLATNEIGNPTNLATLAIMAVFASLFLITGMTGQFFYAIAFSVPVAMLASLLVAYIVTPWAANRWLKPGEGHDLADEDKGDKLHKIYYYLITPILKARRKRYCLIIVVILAIIISMLQLGWYFIFPQADSGPLSRAAVAFSFLPKDNKNTFNITIDMPEATPVELTDQIAREIGHTLRSNNAVSNYQTWIGQSGVIDFNGLLRGSGNKLGPHLAEIRVNLIDKSQRKNSSIDIVKALREKLQPLTLAFPGAVIQLVEDPPGPPVRATLLAEIYGTNLDVIRDISAQVEREFKNTFDVVDVHNSETTDIKQYRLFVDKEKSALSGVSTQAVKEAIELVTNGVTVGRLHMPAEKNIVAIHMQIPREELVDRNLLSRVFVTNRENKKIPVSELSYYIETTQERPIHHKDYERVTYVGAELKETAPVYAVMNLDKRLDELLINQHQLTTANLGLQPVMPNTINGYSLLWSGEMRITLDTFRDLVFALGLALMFIYLLLTGYYRSFIVPLIAMSAIPLGMIGVFPGHWLMGQSFSAPSMIGLIALSGVVVRNSLLIIDFVMDYLKSGMPLLDAVKEAGAVRMKPILLTALAIILGSAVMLSDPVFSGLAISLIFGTLSSTLLTLVIVPTLLYAYLKRATISENSE